MKYVAVLLTVYNRKEQTISCLNSFQEQSPVANVFFEIFLVDDGSTDGTYKEVENKFPDVNLIKGKGDLFWNGGMRTAWFEAINKKKFDFFLWLNDDIVLTKDSLRTLFKDYANSLIIDKNPSIITGACRKKDSITFSYGGRNDIGVIEPNGKIQLCKYINGNVVLVPFEVYERIGVLSSKFTHAMGDFDYGLRAQKQGVSCYTTSEYIALCDLNPISGWKDHKVPFKKRLNLFRSPKGLNAKEFMYFTKRHNGFFKTCLVYVKIHFNLFFPKTYDKIKKY